MLSNQDRRLGSSRASNRGVGREPAETRVRSRPDPERGMSLIETFGRPSRSGAVGPMSPAGDLSNCRLALPWGLKGPAQTELAALVDSPRDARKGSADVELFLLNAEVTTLPESCGHLAQALTGSTRRRVVEPSDLDLLVPRRG